MMNRKITLLVIVLLALCSFHRAPKKFYFFVKNNIESYRADKGYLLFTEKKTNRERHTIPITTENNTCQVQLIYFKLE